MKNTSIELNEFVKRQTPSSRFSYFDGTNEELISLVTENFSLQKESYRDGVILIPVPPKSFFSALCKVEKNSILETKYVSRRDNEEPVLVTVLKNGSKCPAQFVDIVLYRHDVLVQNGENSTDADWEIISINASIVEKEPITPSTMARNMLTKVGGTAAEYSATEFAEAVWFWNQYCMYEPS